MHQSSTTSGAAGLLRRIHDENAPTSHPVTPPGSSPVTPTSSPPPDDAGLLDAYSQAVIRVVESVGPAVIGVSGSAADGRSGSGSGFLLTPDGYALTNSHVAGGRRRLSATTHDGDRLDAELIGDDPATDLALIRVSARDLPYAAPINYGWRRRNIQPSEFLQRAADTKGEATAEVIAAELRRSSKANGLD